ncbi:hypothetical protein U9M48_021756 [Paspalum notatum var. saurae]|uniref:BED-type domain-containing protein n=1 Tax=Paspalum notatum var. saurae TaxID=547442 RepID=A0AAQ3WT98_PASNO
MKGRRNGRPGTTRYERRRRRCVAYFHVHQLCAKPKPNPGRPPLAVKRTTAKQKSRLATAGAPPAPTTPEASSSGNLLKSLGFTINVPQGQGSSVNDSEPIHIDDDDEDESGEVYFGTKRKLTFKVWQEFKKIKVGGEIKAKCNYCHKHLGGKSKNGTKHLHDHLAICTLKKIKMAGQNKTLAQSSLRFKSQEGGKVSVKNYTFDPEVARKEFGAMIVLHEYPLSMVEHTGFRRFVSALQPLFKMVTRNTIRKDIMDTYQEERENAKNYMGATKSRVAITTDLWTPDNQKRGYMAVTAYFIDDSWTLRNIIMRFIYVSAPHTAEIICEELYEALVDWNLDEKMSTLTLDNCSTNDKVITELVKKIGKAKLMLKGKLLHMRCAAHILNLIVKDGLDVIKDSIAKIRESVTFWTATPKRIEKFEEIAKHCKVKLDHKLGLDCKTRWNFTYKMLSIALPYKAVFNRAKRVEKLYDCAPSEQEWDFAREFVDRLKLFNDITEIFSETNYVTSNVQLLKICEAKEQIRKWGTCGNPIIEKM